MNMGHFKNQEIEMLDRIESAAREAIVSIAPRLSEVCNESMEELIEIWDGNLDELREEAAADFNDTIWTRFDCYYADRVMKEVAGFVIISLENDW